MRRARRRLVIGRGFRTRRVALDAGAFHFEQGYAVSTAMPSDLPPGDDVAHPARSPLRLLEDGREIGPAHASHAAIAAEGRGRFSHWERSLRFSSSDGTSPLTNGRRYDLLVPGATSLQLARIRHRLRSTLLPARFDLSPAAMTVAQGYAWTIKLDGGLPPGDSLAEPSRSALRLTEDRRRLGPAHAAHAAIATLGGGRFSHWGAELRFSASDDTSPATNGRRYSVMYPSPLARGLAAIAKVGRVRLARLACALPHRFASLMLARSGVSDTLFFFYDFKSSPVGYDIVSQLVIAELERRARGLSTIHLVLVPGPWRHRHQDGYDLATPDDEVALRISQLALAVPALLPSCAGVTLCASRGEATWMRATLARHSFPRDYDTRQPAEDLIDLALARAPGVPRQQFFPMLHANDHARRAVAAFLRERLGDRRAVVITLRQSAFMPSRNSSLADWVAFADGLDAERYAAVFVPDTARALGGADPSLRRHIVLEAASWNLPLRMALYEAAYINMAQMGGPMELAFYNGACRYVIFMPLDASPQSTREMLSARGFVIGRDLPFATPLQRIKWEPDSLPAMERAFAEIEAAIEDAGNSAG